MFFNKSPKIEKNVIFVLGSGRSGTHLLGRTIGSHPLVQAFIEDPKWFFDIQEIATDLSKKDKLFPKVIIKYNKQFKRVSKPTILEKSHPNIWLVEDLQTKFEKAKFIGIYRSVYSTVASMILHEGVSGWPSKLPNDKINPFLGITEKNIGYYSELPVESKHALRWLSHKKRLMELDSSMGNNFILVKYEDLVENSAIELKRMADFMEIGNDFQMEPIKIESLDKWKTQLTPREIENIDEILKKQEDGHN